MRKSTKFKALCMAAVMAVSSLSVGITGMAESSDGGTFYMSQVMDYDDRIGFPWLNLDLSTTLMYRGLFLADYTMTEVEPDLAESYEVSDDGLTYTIKLKEGLKWSDGEEITAEDVIFSVKTCLRATQVNGIYTTAFKYITGAQDYVDGVSEELEGLSADGSAITFKLDSAYSTFVDILAQFSILPEHCLADEDPLNLVNSTFWSNPVTSGMYKFGELATGSYYSLVINENYEGTAPQIEKIVNYYVSDEVAAVSAGTSYYQDTNSADECSQLNEMSNMTCYNVDSLFYKYFICNIRGVDGNENPVMADARVREAILYALDREALASLYNGAATVIHNGTPVSYEANDGVTYEYNPDKAIELLNEAGYDWNQTFRVLYYNGDETSKNIIAAVVYYLEAIGMKVESTFTDQGTVDLFTTRNYDIGFKGNSAFAINEYYNEYNSSSSTFQNILGGDTAFDDLLAQLSAAQTTEEKNEVLTQLQALEEENLYKLPLFTVGFNVYINTDKVNVPEGVQFGNPRYRCDLNFEEWTLN